MRAAGRDPQLRQAHIQFHNSLARCQCGLHFRIKLDKKKAKGQVVHWTIIRGHTSHSYFIFVCWQNNFLNTKITSFLKFILYIWCLKVWEYMHIWISFKVEKLTTLEPFKVISPQSQLNRRHLQLYIQGTWCTSRGWGPGSAPVSGILELQPPLFGTL